jgi:aspartyl-tRNA(Asn)/glutamyl-tRNA(Gln) amidotransferase subunit A
MVPLAIGTQTAGSVIRPASFCGIVGYKPSFGLISRTGVLPEAPSLDTIGVFATTVPGAALLAEALMGFDPADPAMRPGPVPHLLEAALSAPSAPPKFAFVRQPAWSEAAKETKALFAGLIERLDDRVEEVALGEEFAVVGRAQAIIQKAELARSYARYAERGAENLGPKLLAGIAEGGAILARDYLTARDWQARLPELLDPVFDRFDAILTPASPGPAPKGLETTGDPAFNAIWTLAGTPAITIPAPIADKALPLGIQLVGRHGEDARLLRNAQWLRDFLADT